MRRLKTLNRDAEAKREVGLASKTCQSGDMLDFGLLCFERGIQKEREACARRVLDLDRNADNDLISANEAVDAIRKGEP